MGAQPSSPFARVHDHELWKIHGVHGIPPMPNCPTEPETWATQRCDPPPDDKLFEMEEFELDYTDVPPGGKPRKIGDADRISRYVEAHPDTFAGRWIEPEPVPLQFIAFTDAPENHLAALCSLVHAPDQIRVIQFRYSYRHLLELKDQIVDILGTSDGLSWWGPHVQSNRVVVHVLPERIDAVRRRLMESHPNEIDVEPGGPVVTL